MSEAMHNVGLNRTRADASLISRVYFAVVALMPYQSTFYCMGSCILGFLGQRSAWSDQGTAEVGREQLQFHLCLSAAVMKLAGALCLSLVCADGFFCKYRSGGCS